MSERALGRFQPIGSEERDVDANGFCAMCHRVATPWGDVCSKVKEERDAAVARAEQAEAERDEAVKALQRIRARSAHSIGRGLSQCFDIADGALASIEAARAALFPDPSGEAKPDDPFAADRRPG